MAYDPWNESETVRSTIFGNDGTGTYRPVQVDANGALKIQGAFSATVTAVEESVGATGIAIPTSATLIGGPDAGGLLRTPAVLNTTPVGTEYALLVRQVGSTGGGLTNAELRATPVPVSLGSTTITGTVAVTGTFWQATQPVSIASSVAVTGPLTDTQLRATPVPVTLTSTTITGTVAVTGTFWQATQPVSIAATVNVSDARLPASLGAQLPAASLSIVPSTGSTFAVTGTFWQATQPVSLSAAVTVSQGTAANLRTQTSSESAIGAAVSANATLTGGSDGINLRALKVDTDGRIVTLQLSDTPSVTRVATSVVSAQLLAANATRKGVIVVNESSGVMYLKFGIAASATSYTYRLVANAVCEIAFGYTGRIDAILNTGTGNAQITELT